MNEKLILVRCDWIEEALDQLKPDKEGHISEIYECVYEIRDFVNE